MRIYISSKIKGGSFINVNKTSFRLCRSTWWLFWTLLNGSSALPPGFSAFNLIKKNGHLPFHSFQWDPIIEYEDRKRESSHFNTGWLVLHWWCTTVKLKWHKWRDLFRSIFPFSCLSPPPSSTTYHVYINTKLGQLVNRIVVSLILLITEKCYNQSRELHVWYVCVCVFHCIPPCTTKSVQAFFINLLDGDEDENKVVSNSAEKGESRKKVL